jgi:magnesium-transporting ATPase (P-type)
LLVLAEGDVVPADARVTESVALLLDESALTGESAAVARTAGKGQTDPGDVVSAGTVVVRRRGRAVVIAIGDGQRHGSYHPTGFRARAGQRTRRPGCHAALAPPAVRTVVGAGLWQRIVRVGAVIAAVTLGVGVWAHAIDRRWQTLTFLALGATQLAVALGSRARPGCWANPMLLAAVGVALTLQLGAIYLPGLRTLLGTQPLAVGDLLIITAVSSLGYAAIRLDRFLHRTKRPAR